MRLSRKILVFVIFLLLIGFLSTRQWQKTDKEMTTHTPDPSEPECTNRIRIACSTDKTSPACTLLRERPTETSSSVDAFIREIEGSRGQGALWGDLKEDIICARLMGQKRFLGFQAQVLEDIHQWEPVSIYLQSGSTAISCQVDWAIIQDLYVVSRELRNLRQFTYPITFDVEGIVTNVEIFNSSYTTITLSSCVIFHTSSPLATGTIEDQTLVLRQRIQDAYRGLMETGLPKEVTPPPATASLVRVLQPLWFPLTVTLMVFVIALNIQRIRKKHRS